MAHSNSPLGQLGAVIPAPGDQPDVVTDITLLSTNVEKKIVQKHATRAARNTAVSAPVDGMVTYIADVDEIDTRINSAWINTWPILYSGNSTPSNAVQFS